MLRARMLSVLLLTAASQAQSHVYSPPFLADSEGHDLVSLFGYRPTMRYQMVDGELRGASLALKEIAVRLNWTTGQSPWIARGRTWSNVVLRLADGDRSTFSKVFSTNLLSTPTIAYSGSVSWPPVEQPLGVRPAPWGGKTGAYRMPFALPWRYAGTTDIVTDWTFAGGRLAKSVAWGRYLPTYYHFDGFGSPSSVGVSRTRPLPAVRLSNHSPGVTSRCNDSAMGIHTAGAYLYGDGFVHGSAPANPALKNQLLLRSLTWLTAPNANVIHGWGFASLEPGIPVGTGCNRLHVRGPWILITTVADGFGHARSPDVVTPWRTTYAKGTITMQGAWSDSRSQRLSLTQALELRLPGHAPQDAAPRRSAIFESDVTAVRGPFADGSYNPALRYTH